MDDNTLDAISGAISAQRFLLENLWALVLSQDSDPALACKNTGRELLRQFEDLDPIVPAGTDKDLVFRVTQHGLHHLERIWAGVEDRLRG